MKTKILEKPIVASLYLFSSTATFDLNKYIITVFDLKMHYMLIALQSILIVAIILMQSLFTISPFHYRNIHRWWVASGLLTIMMFTGLKAVYYVPLSLFTIYKNISIILVAILEWYFFGVAITVIGFISFILMILSPFFGSTVDVVKPLGYFWMLLNIVSTAAYVIYIKKMMTVDMSSRTESVFFTNLLSIPILLLFSLIFDPIKMPEITSGLVISIVSSAMMAYCTSFSTAWSMQVLSSTSYTMLGAMNKLIVSASGVLVFNEKFEMVKIIALLVGILSGTIYSLDSIRKREAAASG